MSENTRIDWPSLVDELNRLLRLKTTPIGMKLFERVEDMLAIPKVRRPGAIHTTDQIVAQDENGQSVQMLIDIVAQRGASGDADDVRSDLAGWTAAGAEVDAVRDGRERGRRRADGPVHAPASGAGPQISSRITAMVQSGCS